MDMVDEEKAQADQNMVGIKEFGVIAHGNLHG